MYTVLRKAGLFMKDKKNIIRMISFVVLGLFVGYLYITFIGCGSS